MASEQARVSWRARASACSRIVVRMSNIWRIWSAIFSSLCMMPILSMSLLFNGNYDRTKIKRCLGSFPGKRELFFWRFWWLWRLESTEEILCKRTIAGQFDLTEGGFVTGKVFIEGAQEELGAERGHHQARTYVRCRFTGQDMGKVNNHLCIGMPDARQVCVGRLHSLRDVYLWSGRLLRGGHNSSSPLLLGDG